MKTQQAIKLAGSVKALAALLEITSGAISQWGEEIPQQRVWQLRALKPDWFVLADESPVDQAQTASGE